MPALDWNAFAALPGSPETNFELLCRGIVRRHYDRYSIFRARANQPGVEFHLRLDKPCSLGTPGRWWGWQCKWYDLPSGRALGTTRRKKIEDGIRKTEKHLPGITDWVLWTRHPLAAGDQRWFDGLSTRIKLHLWTGDEVDNHLSGDAALLRATYFGELILRPELLARQHAQSVARIKGRWLKEVHEVLEAEVSLRRMLGDTGSWSELRTHASQLRHDAELISVSHPVTGDLGKVVEGVKGSCLEAADALDELHASIEQGDLDGLRLQLARSLPGPTRELRAGLRRLRTGGHHAALTVTNGLDSLRAALELATAVADAHGEKLVAVVADAGYGKTQLAAQLTAEVEERPAGVLLHGRDLAVGNTLDDLARRIVVAGMPVPSMEALVAAVDAAGQRSRCRLPIVIDALNEAEAPRDWKTLLASLEQTLDRYPHVLLVCTARPAFVDESIPDDTTTLDMPGFKGHEASVFRAYFTHYKIDAADVVLPWGLLSHPLTLRLFCEVTNPGRKQRVSVEAMPGSLTALFEKYLEQCAQRIFELSPRQHRYYPQDVTKTLDVIGALLWEKKSRALEMDGLRAALKDTARPWDRSLVRALEQEGVLIKVGTSPDGPLLAPVYDALAGHLITQVIVSQHTPDSLAAWLRGPDFAKTFGNDYDARHPFATDVFSSLVGSVPHRFHGKQLWTILSGNLRAEALYLSSEVEGVYLDGETVEALASLVRDPPSPQRDLFWRLRETCSSRIHPLNAEFLDRCLRPLGVAERDLRWSEWLWRNHEKVIEDLRRLDAQWQRGLRDGDRLRARWVMWTLTSTVRLIRDQATKALYEFGRRDPEGLFELTVDSFEVNDLYVPERMLAASYGVVMAHQHQDKEFAPALAPYLQELVLAFLGDAARYPTSHWLMRLYVRQTLQFANRFYPQCVPAEVGQDPSFMPGPPVESLPEGDARSDEAGRPLRHSDFSNYTVGKLFEDRANYQMNHAGYQQALADIRGVIWASGWRAGLFKEIDGRIGEQQYRHGDHDPATERYGKKYSWTGFYTYAGILTDAGEPPAGGRLSDIGIDPSFPEKPPQDPDPWPGQDWLRPEIEDHTAWACGTPNDVPPIFIYRPAIGTRKGPWVAVDGWLEREDRILGRQAHVGFSALAVRSADIDRIVSTFSTGRLHFGHTDDLPTDYYLFAGEIPWSTDYSGNRPECYADEISLDNDHDLPVEILAHCYGFEPYHSELNDTGNTLLPSGAFSRAHDLRGIPRSLDQATPDGELASVTLDAPDGFGGQVLYVKEALLRAFIGERTLVWYGWGARLPSTSGFHIPDWWAHVSPEQTEERWVLTVDQLDLNW